MDDSDEPPDTGRLHVSARNLLSPTSSRMAADCACERPSRNRTAGASAVPSAAMGVRPGVVTDSETTPTPAKAGRHLRAALAQRLPPGLGLDVGLAPVVDVRRVGAPRLASLLEVGAEDADLERARPDVDGEDVAAHGRRPSATRSARSASTWAGSSGSSGRRGMPPRNPARVMAALTPATP